MQANWLQCNDSSNSIVFFFETMNRQFHWLLLFSSFSSFPPRLDSESETSIVLFMLTPSHLVSNSLTDVTLSAHCQSHLPTNQSSIVIDRTLKTIKRMLIFTPFLSLLLSLPFISPVEGDSSNATQWSNVCMKNADCGDAPVCNSCADSNETTTESAGTTPGTPINGTNRAYCHSPTQCLCHRLALNVPTNTDLPTIDQLSCTNCSDLLTEGSPDPCTMQDIFSACNNATGYCECTINITHWKATAKQIKLENIFSHSEKAAKSVCFSSHIKAHLSAGAVIDDIRKYIQGIDWDWIVTLVFCYTLPVLALLLFFWFMYTHICAVEETSTEPVLYHQL